jgi:hypothetical protein
VVEETRGATSEFSTLGKTSVVSKPLAFALTGTRLDKTHSFKLDNHHGEKDAIFLKEASSYL